MYHSILRAVKLLLGVALFPILLLAEDKTLTFDLYIVPETEACKPDGYPGCEKLHAGDIEMWKQEGQFAHQSFEIETGANTLRFSPALREEMVAYVNGLKGVSGSAVFVYHIDDFKGMFFSVERVITHDALKNMREHRRSRYVEFDSRHIDHVTLYSVLPAYQTLWRVVIGTESWEFTIE